MNARTKDVEDKDAREWILEDKFATAGIVKMAAKTFKEFSSNLEELVANAYDDDATELEITLDFDDKSLVVRDNGNGMDETQLNSYVCYGESRKTKNYRSPRFGRAPIGEFGMGGKLAITNLCAKCRVVTRKAGWEHGFDMDGKAYHEARYLSDVKRLVKSVKGDPTQHGTELYLCDLRYVPRTVEVLRERLSMKMPLSQNFRVFLEVIKDGTRERVEIVEDIPQGVERQFAFEESLPLVGGVKLDVYYTIDPVPGTRQGIWTKVNGRIVNERQEWYGLERLTSGNKYRWRLFGYACADGLKDSVNFAKNDFIDSPEYREYSRWIHEQLKKVQAELLAADDAAIRDRQRDLVKDVENQVNKWMTKLNLPAQQSALETTIAKIRSERMDEGPEQALCVANFPDSHPKDEIDGKRGSDKEPRRPQTPAEGHRYKYRGRTYRIEPVDMGKHGDLVKFDRELALIEINERHPLYEEAAKNDHLALLTRDVCLAEIARDISNGDYIAFETIYNELLRIAGGVL